jgi:serine/threonine-protein kinase RsbW
LEISNSSPNAFQVSRTFPGFYSSLEKIAGFVCAIAQDTGFDNASLYAIETAVDEACSNIIEHAYGGEGVGNIDITCISKTDQLEIIIHDMGIPFDIDRVPEPNLTTDLENRPSHGLGLYLMRKWMDEVRFEFTATSGNYLFLVKRKKG